jgi:hypothetical protein
VATGDTALDGAARIGGAHVDIGAYEYGSVVPFTVADAIRALRIAGGLQTGSTVDLQRLNIATLAPSSGLLDVLDAVRLARKVVGLEANP